MSIEPTLLLYVDGFDADDIRGTTVLRSYDFLEQSNVVPGPYFLVATQDSCRIDALDLRRIHYVNKGWRWELRAIDRCPKTPFLLTDCGDYGVIYSGAVFVELPEEAKWLFSGDTENLYLSSEAVVGDDWIGMLRITSHENNQWHLIAFSRDRICLPTEITSVRLHEFDAELGPIRLI